MTGVTDERAEGAAPPGVRSEELATSDEGRRCLKGARDERETHGASRGRGAAWTEERGARDERRGKAVPQRRPETSGKHTERAEGAAPPGLRSEELATSDEGRRCLKGARDERETQ